MKMPFRLVNKMIWFGLSISGILRPVIGHATSIKARPSFDCSKASSSVEKMICSDASTSEADRKLGEAYRLARGAIGKDQSQIQGLMRSQNQWASGRMYCLLMEVRPSECLLHSYQERTAFLRNVISEPALLLTVPGPVHPLNCAMMKNWSHAVSREKLSSMTVEEAGQAFAFASSKMEECWTSLEQEHERTRYATNLLALATKAHSGCEQIARRFDYYQITRGYNNFDLGYLKLRLNCRADQEGFQQKLHRRSEGLRAETETAYKKIRIPLAGSALMKDIEGQREAMSKAFASGNSIDQLITSMHASRATSEAVEIASSFPKECPVESGGCYALVMSTRPKPQKIFVKFTAEAPGLGVVTAVEVEDRNGGIRKLELPQNKILFTREMLKAKDCTGKGSLDLVFGSMGARDSSWTLYSIEIQSGKLVETDRECEDSERE